MRVSLPHALRLPLEALRLTLSPHLLVAERLAGGALEAARRRVLHAGGLPLRLAGEPIRLALDLPLLVAERSAGRLLDGALELLGTTNHCLPPFGTRRRHCHRVPPYVQRTNRATTQQEEDCAARARCHRYTP